MSLHDVLLFLQGTNDIAVAIRLVMATIFGGLVGWERIVTHHNAGIKTFAPMSFS
ncbi:MAG: MgtC/SapB family protein [Butyrivibrio sp.]|nr:MgtC/SapB family protein [Butyrivibrio sp.]MBR1643458.1 MgtC/SapB family protein [Butyrivibrio sp.]